MLAGGICGFNLLNFSSGKTLDSFCSCSRFSRTQRHRKNQRPYKSRMPAQPDAKNSHEYAEELIDNQQPADSRRLNAPDEMSGLFLQPVALRQSNRRQRDDKKDHETVISKGPAQHVDNA